MKKVLKAATKAMIVLSPEELGRLGGELRSLKSFRRNNCTEEEFRRIYSEVDWLISKLGR